jgi:hypothetical protein
MKFLTLLTIILLVPFSARAQQGFTPVPKEMANQYFSNCVQSSAKTEQRFSPQAQQMLCACTAARLTQFFSVEDMQTMANTSDPNARIAFNKMLINIYAPCMKEPMREYHYAQCISNPQTGRLTNNPQKMCACAADQLGIQMEVYGSQMFEKILSQNPTIEDPMGAVYSDPEFQTLAQKKALECLK